MTTERERNEDAMDCFHCDPYNLFSSVDTFRVSQGLAKMNYRGDVYLFGLIPVIRGVYAADENSRKNWKKAIKPWIRWACVIRWQGDWNDLLLPDEHSFLTRFVKVRKKSTLKDLLLRKGKK